MRTLPVDRNREFREYDYPQTPGLYTPLRHFCQRFKEDERFLTDEVINSCITEGDLRDNGDGCACFRKEWGDGVAFYLIAGFHEKGYRVVVTAWPHLHDREAALNSGRWSSDELDTIESLNERYQDRFADDYPAYDEWLKTQYGATS
jgi:hypothetical protein